MRLFFGLAAKKTMKHLTPLETAELLKSTPDAVFVDCRSEIEFFYVGHPVGAEHVAWQEPPDWDVQPEFVSHVKALVAGVKSRPVVLICRSGRRSIDAGKVLENAGFSDVYNVLHGFEGDLDENFHRGRKNGWRFDGLPWAQM
jgi:rhodanese-related sulfurtransferase